MTEPKDIILTGSGERKLDVRTGIYIVPSRDETLTDFASKTLTGFYMDAEETVQQRFARAAKCHATKGNKQHAQYIYDAVSLGYFMFASPVLSNAWLPPENPKGLPISCFLNEPGDTIAGIIAHEMEVRWLTVMGGGIGAFWNTRAESKKSYGVIPHQHTMDAAMQSWAQGTSRRGSYAAYMKVKHPNFREFMTIRVPTGDEGRKCLGEGYHHGAILSNEFMETVISGGEWDYVDPDDNTVRGTESARAVWDDLMDVRYRTGEPYLFFEENAQAGLHPALKAKGLYVKASNLCAEIMLPTTPDRTAVCCLSSLNCETRDEWPVWLVPVLVEMLDNVLQSFIDQAPPELWRAVASAKAERSIGLGLMGFHYYLQKKGIKFESQQARDLDIEIFSEIQAQAVGQSYVLGGQRGEAEDLIGTGRRNAHLMAIAPNANSAILLGTSPSIEPNAANAYVHRTRAGSFPVKNKYLEKLLEEKGKNDAETWKSIVLAKGSVQHLPFLTDDEKDVFKTAVELDQRWIIRHAADRQPFIDMGQSVNLFFEPGCDRRYFSDVHILAWRLGLKSLYYVRTSTRHRADSVTEKTDRFDLTGMIREPLHKRIIKKVRDFFKPIPLFDTDDLAEMTIAAIAEEDAEVLPIIAADVCDINGCGEIDANKIHAGVIDATKLEVGPGGNVVLKESSDDIWGKAVAGAEDTCAACSG